MHYENGSKLRGKTLRLLLIFVADKGSIWLGFPCLQPCGKKIKAAPRRNSILLRTLHQRRTRKKK